MQLDVAALTDIGRRKKKNEDNFGVFREGMEKLQLFKEGALLIVADGLGGHIGGEIASKLAVSVFSDMLKEARPEESAAPDEQDVNLHAMMKQWLALANDNIFQTNQDLVKDGKPMGTTLCAALVEAKKAHIVNCGDSRAYHIRGGEIIALTEDHSWVDEQVKLGNMSKEDAEKDQRKNLVTRCLGTHPAVDGDIYLWHTVPGDMLLLCSDGLVNMMKDADIRAEFNKGAMPAEIARRLVDIANENGGKDNITVIVTEIEPKPFEVFKRKQRAFFRKHGKCILHAVLVLLFGVACFAGGLFASPYILPCILPQ